MASRPRQPPGSQSTRAPGETPPPGAQNDDLEAQFERRRRPIQKTFGAEPAQKNSISATSREKRSAAELPPDASRESESPGRGGRYAVPEGVTARYEQSGERFYLGGELAFLDRGRVLQTPFENKEIIRDLIDIQIERGSTAIVVAGSERFRREAWLQATVVGLEVKGYRPTEREAELPAILRQQVESQSRDAPERQPIEPDGIDRPSLTSRLERTDDWGTAPIPEPAESNRPFRGRLIDHGEAPYQFDARNPRSYFVKLDTQDGEVIQWGADLARAVRQSLSGARSGDEVVVRQLGQKPVTVTRPTLDGRGTVVRQEEVKAWLNQWSVERVDFLRDRARLAEIIRDPSIDSSTALRQRPELKGTYEELAIAGKVAPRLYADRHDQQRFVARLRTALADEIQRGEPLSATRSRSPGRERTPDDPRTPRQVHERVLS